MSEELVKGKIEIFLLTENKLDKTFPNEQLEIQDYKTLGKDRSKHRCAVRFYVNENILWSFRY